jgi:hypothetical protein
MKEFIPEEYWEYKDVFLTRETGKGVENHIHA